MRCLENICKQDLIEEENLELFYMDNRDIDLFMTDQERRLAESVIAVGDKCMCDLKKNSTYATKGNDYNDHSCFTPCKLPRPAEIDDQRFEDMEKDPLMDIFHKNIIHADQTDDDNAKLTMDSIMSHYDGCDKLDSLDMEEINKEYDIINGEEKYDG